MTKVLETCTLDEACCVLECDGQIVIGDSVDLTATVESLLPNFLSAEFLVTPYNQPVQNVPASGFTGPPDGYVGNWVPSNTGYHFIRLVVTQNGPVQHAFNLKTVYVAPL